VTAPNAKVLAPHYVVWLAALVFVTAGCGGNAGSPAATGPAASGGAVTTAAIPGTATPDATASPADEPTPTPPDSVPPDSAEPPLAVLVGGIEGPRAGDLGTFSWDGLVSDSPWIVQRTGSPVTPGARLRVRFDPRLVPRAWSARWAPVRHGEAGAPRDAGSGGGGRVSVEAPMDAGPWSLRLDATFADGRRAVWYWRLGVGG